jgi:hypothetical protein
MPTHRHQGLGLAAELLTVTAYRYRDSTPYYGLLTEVTAAL